MAWRLVVVACPSFSGTALPSRDENGRIAPGDGGGGGGSAASPSSAGNGQESAEESADDDQDGDGNGDDVEDEDSVWKVDGMDDAAATAVIQ